MGSMLRLMLKFLVFSIVIFSGAIVLLQGAKKASLDPEIATVYEEALPLPKFTLIDQKGLRFHSNERLLGHFSLIFFGFTHCPDICPFTLQKLVTVTSSLESQGANLPEVLFVSVDSNRDTPERIDSYLDNFSPKFVGLTGNPGALQVLLSKLGLTTQIHQHPGQQDYTVIHNSTVFVIAPKGELIATFSGLDNTAVNAATIAEDFLRIRKRYLAHPPRLAT